MTVSDTERLAESKTRRKGETTREMILDGAVELAARVGLEGLSIGVLADRAAMSKSGLFAHFRSKEDLQLATLHRASEVFRLRVLGPSIEYARGLGQLRALFDNWISSMKDGTDHASSGTLLIASTTEFDDRPGLVRGAIVEGQRALRGAIAKIVRSAIDSGELAGNVDPWQIAFELHGIVLAAYHEMRLLNDHRAEHRARVAFERLVRDNQG